MVSKKVEFTILVLEGDGIGPEVTEESRLVLDQISALPNGQLTFKLLNRLFRGCSINKHGVPVTPEVLEEGRTSDAILMGATGGPKWDGIRRGVEGCEGGTTLLRARQSILRHQQLDFFSFDLIILSFRFYHHNLPYLHFALL